MTGRLATRWDDGMTNLAAKKVKTAAPTDLADRTLFVNSLHKGFAILKAFSREQPRLTLSQLTRLSGLDKSAAQRFVFTLHAMGYLTRDEETKQYRLSPRVLEFGYTYLYSDRIIETAQPFLVEAHKQTGETVNLAVLDGADIILVSRLPSQHVVSLNIQIGLRIPALYSASGLAIVSCLDATGREEVIRRTEFKAHTPRSLTKPAEMRALLEKLHADGHAIVHAQYFPNDISVAAPITDNAGRPLGAISISAPDTRVRPGHALKRFVPCAKEAARKASIAMGAF